MSDDALLRETPLHAREFSAFERLTVAFLTLCFLALAFGITMKDAMPDNLVSVAVYDYMLAPLLEDSTGDSGYNWVDTVVYSLVLVSFVVVLSAWLRRLGVNASDKALLSLLPWVVWAALGEVNEDAGLFGGDMPLFFISPIVHFHIAGWVVLSGFCAHLVSKRESEENAIGNVTKVSILLTLLQGIFFLQHFTKWWEFSWLSPLFWAPVLGVLLIVLMQPLLACCNTRVEQGLIQTGIGGIGVQLAGWLSVLCEPVNGADPVGLAPIVLVTVVPLIICLALYFVGRGPAKELHHMGLEAGYILLGITLDDWDRQRSSTFERLEALTPRAVLASVPVLAAMYGQMYDGMATWLGIDIYQMYAEKHVLSNLVIELGGGGADGVGGTWLFMCLKFGLAGVIWALFAVTRFEERHRHMRQLVILCLLTVGLAPGLRDVFRLALGV